MDVNAQALETTTTTGGGLDRETLTGYLDTHLLGATNGVRLFKSVGQSWAGTEHGKVLTALGRDVAKERAGLKKLIKRLGHRPGKIKMILAHAGARVAAVNPLNVLRSPSGEGAQLELEALQSLLRGKEALWDTLLVLAETPAGRREPALNPAELKHLLEKARDQQKVVAAIMRQTAGKRFLLH